MNTIKIISLLLLFCSGCASVSEYGHGCRDGLRSDDRPEERVSAYCDYLERLHNHWYIETQERIRK